MNSYLMPGLLSDWGNPEPVDPNKIPQGLLAMLQGGQSPTPMQNVPQMPGSQGLLAPGMEQPQAAPDIPMPPPRPADLPAPGAAPAGPMDINQAGSPMEIRPQIQQQQQAAQPGTQPQGNEPGFFDKFGKVVGSIYGAGGPGDGLINLGLALASPGNKAQNLQRAFAMQGQQQLQRQQLAAAQLKQAQAQMAMQGQAKLLSERLGIPIEQATALALSPAGAKLIEDQYKTSPPIAVAEGSTLYDPKTQQTIMPGGPKQTDPQRDYQFYVNQETQQGRQPKSFSDWDIFRRRAQNQQEFGTIPSGYQLQRSGEGGASMVPIPGSPAALAAQAAADKTKTSDALKSVRSDIVVQDVGKVMDAVKNATLPVTGAAGSFLANIKGTTSHDVAATLGTLKSITRIDTLQQMRNSSPTGGALGNVSDGEGKMLESALGSLEQSQSKEQFVQNLQRFKEMYLRVVHGPDAAAKIMQQEQASPSDGWQEVAPGVRIREKR